MVKLAMSQRNTGVANLWLATHMDIRTCEYYGQSLSRWIPRQTLDIPTNPATGCVYVWKRIHYQLHRLAVH